MPEGRLRESYAAILIGSRAAYWFASASVGGMLPISSSRRWWLNQSTHSRVLYSTASNDFYGPGRWMNSALNSPITLSASALSLGSSPRAGCAVADTADGWIDDSFPQTLGVADADILRSAYCATIWFGRLRQSGWDSTSRHLEGYHRVRRWQAAGRCLIDAPRQSAACC
jgi:hypothetical protein